MGQKRRAQGRSSRGWVWKKTGLRLRLFGTFPFPSLDSNASTHTPPPLHCLSNKETFLT